MTNRRKNFLNFLNIDKRENKIYEMSLVVGRATNNCSEDVVLSFREYHPANGIPVGDDKLNSATQPTNFLPAKKSGMKQKEEPLRRNTSPAVSA